LPHLEIRIMKWVLLLIGIILALVLVVALIGALLPRDHVATMTARIGAPPSAVWAAITQPEQFPTWRTDVSRVEMLTSSATGPSWREYSKHGALTMAIDAAEPPRHLVTRILDENLPYGGVWQFDIIPDGSDASRVSVTERGWVSNPIFRFVSRFIMGHTASIDAYLRALGKHFGNEPTPAAVASTGAPNGL
jgi:uncharacterized protein YndB with AHSA1/START domain